MKKLILAVATIASMNAQAAIDYTHRCEGDLTVTNEYTGEVYNDTVGRNVTEYGAFWQLGYEEFYKDGTPSTWTSDPDLINDKNNYWIVSSFTIDSEMNYKYEAIINVNANKRSKRHETGKCKRIEVK